MTTSAKLIFCALCLAALVGCQLRPTNQHKLLIYTPHGQDMLRDFIARYKQAHPEVDIQFLDMGSREVLERLRAERNRPQADLWWGAAHTTFQTAADENLLAPTVLHGPTKSPISHAMPRIAGTELMKHLR